MNCLSTSHLNNYGAALQRGTVLIFTLVALVAMTMATLLLVRAVDTNTLISGNLAFRKAATTSADAGVEAAVAALLTIENANKDKNVYMNAAHPFNVTDASTGYYSSNVDPALNLTDAATWGDHTSSDAVVDGSGNTYRYIVQRMCRTKNQVLSKTNCLLGGSAANTSSMDAPLPSNICVGPGCPKAGQTAQYLVTVRVTGPKNTVSYVQAIVY